MQVVNRINWFPGHMAKGYRQLKERISLIDGVLELIDARAPISSKNLELEKIIACKPRLLILNKADLADQEKTTKFKDYFKKMYNIEVIAANSLKPKLFVQIRPIIRKMLNNLLRNNKSKGVNKPLKLIVVGIPNVGKSALINNGIGSKKLKVENKPGVTKAQQWVKIEKDIELLDTAGVLWPKIKDRNTSINLALIGSIKDNILDEESLAEELISILKEKYRMSLIKRYKITNEDLALSNFEILKLIGKKRGILSTGGEISINRISNILIDEFRCGKLGEITLDIL